MTSQHSTLLGPLPILQNLDPDVNVLLISGESNPDVVRALLAQGARGLLRKPFDLKQLKAALAELEPDPS
jgi:DNA-binding NarL/FixJ family response regulator